MHNYQKHIVAFDNLSGYYTTENFIKAMVNATNRFLEQEPQIDPSGLKYKDWVIPENFTISRHYYLLYYIAKMVKVKLMWRNLLIPGYFKSVKGIRIIGELNRINICYAILHSITTSLYQHKAYLKKNLKVITKGQKIGDFRQYSSKQLQIVIEHSIANIKDKLVDNTNYTNHLETLIKEYYRLDYKKYKSNRVEYYYAISKKYHHKRMVL